jgi:hypothetical protein
VSSSTPRRLFARAAAFLMRARAAIWYSTGERKHALGARDTDGCEVGGVGGGKAWAGLEGDKI